MFPCSLVIYFPFVQQVKTEEQIAAEHTWFESEKVWLIHKGGFSLGEVELPLTVSLDSLVLISSHFRNFCLFLHLWVY